jgi:cell division protein FtsI (penicillin-binding protein 3)
MSRVVSAPSVALYMRGLFVGVAIAGLFAAVGVQLIRLSMVERPEIRVASAEPIGRVFARPDILDRGGRLVATDVAVPSLYADPALLIDLDEVIEKLTRTFPDLDAAELRKALGDRNRRFAWIKRGLTPRQAQRVHDLGLPGLAFRQEPKRVYPAGALLGHLVGYVNVDNKGAGGLERYIDDNLGIESVLGAAPSRIPPVALSIDLGAQQALAAELKEALTRYQASGAAGLVMDVTTGELVAAVSLPELDPDKPLEAQEDGRENRLSTGVYELGSIFKVLTVAMALDEKTATLDKIYDVRQPMVFGKHTISDLHPQGRPLSVRDVFIHSSNVGAGMIALEAGSARQIGFLSRFGLLSGARTEAGPVAAPIVPKRWGEIETVTIAYGHGLATTPVHFSAAVAALVNGGTKVTPTVLARRKELAGDRLVRAETSAGIRELLRLNVTSPHGTGRRAEVAGYRVGGKTGTAEMPGKGGYQKKSVISSFVAAFPMDAPRFLTFVSLFEPRASEETKGQITAGLNAAPVTGRLIARVAPLLDVLPERTTQDAAARAN